MSTSDNDSGRSRTQGLISDPVSRAYREYGTMTAVPGQSQAADADSPGQGTLCSIAGDAIFFFCNVIMLGAAFCTSSSTWIVIGHRVCLYFSPAPSPYSEASLWSTFLFGFLGSATTALPIWVLFTSLDSDCEEYLPALLKLALITVKITLDCIIGVPVVQDFGVVTLKLGYAVLAAYIGMATVILVMVCMTIMLILVAATLPGIEIRHRASRNSDRLPHQAEEAS